MGTPWYATRGMLARAADTQPTAAAGRELDSLLASATRSVNSLLVRPFGMWPTVATYSFDFPSRPSSRSWRLWLAERTLISLTSATSAGNSVTLLPYPLAGPPYTSLELDRAGSGVLGGGDSSQGDVQVTGVWGYRNDEAAAGALTAGVNASVTALPVSAATAAAADVGDLLRVGAERVIVTGRTWVATGETVPVAGLAARNNDTSLAVASGAGFAPGETLLIGGERVIVQDVAGNTLLISRAAGTQLEAHASGAAIYASRSLEVERGALGTTAATHLNGDAVMRWLPDPLATELCLAEALNTGAQRLSAYARTAGTGEAQQEMIGRALADIRRDARRALGRRSRVTAV